MEAAGLNGDVVPLEEDEDLAYETARTIANGVTAKLRQLAL